MFRVCGWLAMAFEPAMPLPRLTGSQRPRDERFYEIALCLSRRSYSSDTAQKTGADMAETILYLLKSNFADPIHGDQLFFCPQCSPIEGLLAMFPDVRQNLDVRYVDFARPRGDMADFVGHNQSCPQIVLPKGDDAFSAGSSEAGQGAARRIEAPADVQRYLIERFDLPLPHP
jgi:hypothetical protein